jgi:hypothetical protein
MQWIDRIHCLLQLWPRSSSPLSRLLMIPRAINIIRVKFWSSTSLFPSQLASALLGSHGPPLAAAGGHLRWPKTSGAATEVSPTLNFILLLPCAGLALCCCSHNPKDSESASTFPETQRNYSRVSRFRVYDRSETCTFCIIRLRT